MQALSHAQATDSEVIEKVLLGEISFFELLVRRHNPALYKVGRAFGFNHHDVEDLMQETHVAAYLHLQQFAGRSSYKTWLTRIMVNQCRQRLQKSSQKNEVTTREEAPENAVAMFTQPTPDPNQGLLNKELSRILEQLIGRLPTDYSTVFTMRELNGLSVTETAEVLAISEGNVKVRLNRARHLLRKQLEKFYSPEDIFEFNLIYCDRIAEQVMARIRALNN